MNVHVLQHVPFEGLGSIEGWLTERGAVTSTTRLFDSPQLPELADLDLIIALGGPMSVNDEGQLPWLKEKKRFITDAVVSGKAVLRICLGAQLIASALGARVYPGLHKELGRFDIESTTDSSQRFQFPRTATVFHWHGVTFDLPSRASRLARSAGCENRAFQIGRKVIGLRFHLETTPESAELLVAHCRNELVEGRFIQSEEALRSVPKSRYTAVNALMAEVLTYLTQ